jgi:hypothetical protein
VVGYDSLGPIGLWIAHVLVSLQTIILSRRFHSSFKVDCYGSIGHYRYYVDATHDAFVGIVDCTPSVESSVRTIEYSPFQHYYSFAVWI